MFPFFHPSLFSLISFFILLSLFIIPFKWFFSSASKTHKNPPPSPRKLPIIGNFHHLGSKPLHNLTDLARKHGPLVLIHLGNIPLLVASSARAAQEILKTHDLIFSNRPKLSIPDMLTYGSKDIGFSPYGEYWRNIKRIAVLQLLSSKRVQSFRHVRKEETARMIDMIAESNGWLVNLSELFVLLTNNVVCRVALGRTYHGLKFNDLLKRLMDVLGVYSVGSYVKWLSWVDWLSGLERRAKKVAKEFDEFLEGVIEEHINKKRVDGDGENDEGRDFVDILLDVQRESENSNNLVIHRDSVKAVIMDMFAAGTDTTSISMEWAVSELVRHPQVMKKLQKEVKEVAQGRSMINEEDLEKMKYLKAVIKETLRLHPPIPLMIPRESTKYVKLMGYDIAAGTQVIINAWAIGRDPSLWDESEKFKPERFLNSSIEYKGLHFQFLPFGGGRRECPGIQFAIAVNELALANLVYKYDLVLPDEKRGEELDMSESTGITVHRKSPLLVVATPRF